MKNLTKTTLLALLLLISPLLRAQVLISLLFGEALNTPKIEFGLVGGLNRSYLADLPGAEGLNHFNLGFYFHLNVKNNSFISTGLLVN